jgi:site-specific recombinase XerD
MSQNFKVLFFLKKGRKSNPKSLPIYVRVTINGERAEWTSQRHCDPGIWNQQTGRVSGKKEETKSLNQYLDAIQTNIFQVHKEYALRNEPVTATQVRARVLHQYEEKKHTLIQVYQYHNVQFQQLVGSEFSHGTYKKFKSALNSLRQFLLWKFCKEDLYLTEVNHKFITDYEFYLKSVQNLQHNSAMVNIKKLKKIIRLCVANDWLDKDPFKSYKITTKETSRNFLLQDELEMLRNKDITVKRLDQVRDIFLFSCYTGLSYSDLMLLTQKDVSIGIDGEQWIFTTRIKTDTASRIPLLPIAREIINKYAKEPDIINSGRLLPILSNQRMNGYLKEISDLCGFNKELTFHCARHTFATTVTLTNGVPIETVSKMLGHKSLRTTQIYAKILDNKVSDDMKALREKLGGDSASKRSFPYSKAQ